MPKATAPLFGRLLRAFRNRAGLSQGTLAAYLSVAPATISRIETGRENPPEDPAFYERLRAVSGFTEAEVTLLQEAEDLGTLLARLEANRQSSRDILESRLKNPQSGSSREVRRQGLAGKNARDRARLEATKANEDLATLLAHHARLALSHHDVLAQARRVMAEWHQEFPEEVLAYAALLTELSSQIMAQAFTEAMKLADIARPELVQPSTQAPQAAPTTGEEESWDITQILQKLASISLPMPPPEVEHGDHLTSPTPEQGDPSTAQGTNAPESGREQPGRRERRRAPKKGDVYNRDREHYSRERLQATAPTLSKLLLEAIANPDDPLSSSAVRALGEFAKDAIKIRGISANSAAREFNAPPDFFSRWAKELGIIPALLEGTGQGSATILDREEARGAAETFHEAKRQGIRPSTLHQRMSSSYGDQREISVPAEPSPGVIYEKDTIPEIRAREQGRAQSYEVVTSLQEAAEKSGIPIEEIVTTRDIATEWNINPGRIHEWTRRGPHGQPHLTPLPVRLRGERGSNQRLFRREDVARKVADPPKPGPPPKHSRLPSPQ